MENKITSLERQFRLACDWTQATGQGVEDAGQFEAAALKRCPLCRELEGVIAERPNAKPLATNEDSSDSSDSDLGFDGEDSNTGLDTNTGLVIEKSVELPPKEAASVAASSVTASERSTRKRLSARKGKGKAKKSNHKQSTDSVVSELLGEDSEDGNESHRSLRAHKVSAREREASARMMEAQANSAKASEETDLPSIDEQVKLLKARKTLLDEGACTEEDIDLCLPLKKPRT